MFRFIHVSNNLKQQCQIKNPQRYLLRSSVAYGLQPTVLVIFFCVGQTFRILVERLDKHQASPKSEVCSHLQSNQNHRVVFNNPNILKSSADKSKLLIF